MRKRLLSLVLVCTFLHVVCFCTYGQNRLGELQKKFQEYAVANLQEKLFVHTDKDFYLTGENLWMNLYVVDGMFHRPVTISRIAYVEVIDYKNEVVVQSKVKVANGTGSGNIVFHEGLKSGKYILRAYTRWMRNYKPDFFFSKVITIANPEEGEIKISLKSAEDVHVVFSPEGGTLVYGLSSKVGINVTDSHEEGVDCSGVIVDESGQTVLSFETLKPGIGNFIFTPQHDHTYKVLIKTVDGKERVVDLPKIQSEGYVIALTEAQKDSIHIKVQFSGNGNGQNILLFAHTRNVAKVALEETLQNNVAEFRIHRNRLGDGITHITLFNRELEPITERLYFKKPEDSFSLQTTLNKHVFDQREAVNVSWNVSSKQLNNDRLSHASLSVFLVDSLQAAEVDNMNYYWLLTSDLAPELGWSFNHLISTEQEADSYLDNLMLASKWKRFDWKDILKATPNKKVKYAPDYEGLTVSGKLLNRLTAKPIANAPVLLARLDSTKSLYSAETDENGQFEFYVKEFEGVKDFAFTNLGKESEAEVYFNDPFEELIAYNLPTPKISTQLGSSFRDRVIYSKVLNKQSKEDIIEKATVDSLSFYGQPDKMYNLDDYVRFTTVEEVLREYVAEVIVRRQNGKLDLFILNKDNQTYFTNAPLVLVDDVPVLDHDRLIRNSAQTIQRLEVVTKKFFHGPLSYDGIIHLKTYKADFSGFGLETATLVVSLAGIQSQKAFPHRPYDEKTSSSRLPDFRNTLYWTPSVSIPEEGPANVRFYTSDVEGKFIGVLNGVTVGGKSTTQTFSFQVQRSAP